jgi:hypothetical protein
MITYNVCMGAKGNIGMGVIVATLNYLGYLKNKLFDNFTQNRVTLKKAAYEI